LIYENTDHSTNKSTSYQDSGRHGTDSYIYYRNGMRVLVRGFYELKVKDAKVEFLEKVRKDRRYDMWKGEDSFFIREKTSFEKFLNLIGR
jgi:hypothetical protein